MNSDDKRPAAPDGLHEFEAAMQARGRLPVLRWVTEAHSSDVALHAGYRVGPSFVYVQALKAGGWRAFVAARDDDADAVIAALDQRDPFSGAIFRAARGFGASDFLGTAEVDGGIEARVLFRDIAAFGNATEHAQMLRAMGRSLKPAPPALDPRRSGP